MIEGILLIIIVAIFLCIKFLVYKLIEGGYIPEWLKYKPYICEMCLGFWFLTAIYIALSFIFNYIFLVGNIITILDSIAHYIDIKNNTIKSDDYDELDR